MLRLLHNFNVDEHIYNTFIHFKENIYVERTDDWGIIYSSYPDMLQFVTKRDDIRACGSAKSTCNVKSGCAFPQKSKRKKSVTKKEDNDLKYIDQAITLAKRERDNDNRDAAKNDRAFQSTVDEQVATTIQHLRDATQYKDTHLFYYYVLSLRCKFAKKILMAYVTFLKNDTGCAGALTDSKFSACLRAVGIEEDMWSNFPGSITDGKVSFWTRGQVSNVNAPS